MNNKPNLFIVGAAKAGTTSLHYYLDQHPDIFMSKFKEPHFFAEIDSKSCKKEIRFVDDMDKYMELFKLVQNERIIGESSVSYLCHSGTANRIKKFNPEAKIIIVLRNPVERLISHYLMDIRDAKISSKSDLLNVINEDFNLSDKRWCNSHLYVDAGLYYKQVQEYLDTFGSDRVLILYFEDLHKDMNKVLNKITTFLNVENNFNFQVEQQYNTFAVPRNKFLQSIYTNIHIRKFANLFLNQSLKQRITDMFLKKAMKPEYTIQEKREIFKFYRDDIENLEKLLGVDLSNWKYYE